MDGFRKLEDDGGKDDSIASRSYLVAVSQSGLCTLTNERHIVDGEGRLLAQEFEGIKKVLEALAHTTLNRENEICLADEDASIGGQQGIVPDIDTGKEGTVADLTVADTQGAVNDFPVTGDDTQYAGDDAKGTDSGTVDSASSVPEVIPYSMSYSDEPEWLRRASCELHSSVVSALNSLETPDTSASSMKSPVSPDASISAMNRSATIDASTAVMHGPVTPDVTKSSFSLLSRAAQCCEEAEKEKDGWIRTIERAMELTREAQDILLYESSIESRSTADRAVANDIVKDTVARLSRLIAYGRALDNIIGTEALYLRRLELLSERLAGPLRRLLADEASSKFALPASLLSALFPECISLVPATEEGGITASLGDGNLQSPSATFLSADPAASAECGWWFRTLLEMDR